MSQKQTKKKSAASPPPVKQKEDPLAYEMWLTGEIEHGPVEERGAAEGLLLKELQRRGPRNRPGSKTSKTNLSK
ncbi:MAG: hypothetical protein OJF52_001215 [Nitrospira sp.]|jgi:hypothetical protein|nr:MAG: hypothetical protein OJF52_001215 [Nitrospira sp.]